MNTRHIDPSDGSTTLDTFPGARIESKDTEQKKNRLGIIIISLISVYILWGSTYIGMYFALKSIPPFLMAGTRFLVAGGIMFAFLRARKVALPTRKEWLGAAIVGILLLIGGNSAVAFAEKMGAPTGLTAVALGAVPLWVALFAGFFGQWPRRIEWYGLALGFVGLLLLNLGHGLSTNPFNVIVLLISPVCWAFGSVLSQRLSLPKGGMSSASQMLCAGTVLLTVGLSSGERLAGWPALSAIWAMLFLICGGSLIAFTSYTYLLSHVRPALATSYAYVNPIVAVGLGVWLAGERITLFSAIAMLTILSGVVLVTIGQSAKKA